MDDKFIVEGAEMACTGCPGITIKIKLPSGVMKPKSLLEDNGVIAFSNFPSYKFYNGFKNEYALVDFNSTTHRDIKGGSRQMIHTDNVAGDNIPSWPFCINTNISVFEIRHFMKLTEIGMSSEANAVCAMSFFDTWQDYKTDYTELDGYPLIMREPGDSSFLICARGGVITFQTSGQVEEDESLDEIELMLNNLMSDSTLDLTENQRKTLVMLGQILLDAGYEPGFVAGMLGNMQSEGAKLGYFESSAYNSNPERKPSYLTFMDENYDYSDKYSGKNITEMNLSDVEKLVDLLEADNYEKGKFGLGSVQWTGERTKKVLGVYREVVGVDNDRISEEQLIEAESIMIIRELDGTIVSSRDHAQIYPDWKDDNSGNLDSADAAYDAGYKLSERYEKPKSGNHTERAEQAQKIYEVLIGE